MHQRPPATPPLQLEGPGGLAAAVPAVLGFHPRRSLVLVCLTGGHPPALGPLLRVDLAASDPTAVSDLLADHADRCADAVAVFGYLRCGRAGAAEANWTRLAALTGRSLAERHVPICGVWTVDGDEVRAWPPEPRDRPGRPIDPGGAGSHRELVAAATVLAGRRILPDRQALVRSVAAPTGDRAAAAAMAFRRRSRPPFGADVVVDALESTLATGGVPLALAATVGAVLEVPSMRDQVLGQAALHAELPWVAMLVSCANWTPRRYAAGTCATLAVLAWADGDGALALVSADRARAADPQHRLVALVEGMVATGLPPTALRESLRRSAVADRGTDRWSTDLVAELARLECVRSDGDPDAPGSPWSSGS